MAKSKKEAEVTEQEEVEQATKEVVFNTNVKLGEKLYAAGEKASINQDDYDAIVDSGVVEE